MRINEKEVHRLAEAVVAALQKQPQVRVKADPKVLAERIVGVFLDNLRQEAAIEEEAERMADQLARKTAGMDHRRIVMGIKERLAKERGFVL